MAEPLSLFGASSAPTPSAPTEPKRSEQHERPPMVVIPAKQLSARMAAAGWPLDQQQRLLRELDACRRIRTEDGRGCPRYPVDIQPTHAVLVEPAWEYDPTTRRPKAKPIEQGSVQRFWRDDVERPWARATTVTATRRAS